MRMKRNDVTFLNNTKNELEAQIEKYRPRIEELEEQGLKHSQLHDKMKLRLTEINEKLLAKNQEVNMSTYILIKPFLYNLNL